MISHALTILLNELQRHLTEVYGGPATEAAVALGNLADGVGTGASNVPRDMLILSVVNLREEKALKNLPNVVRNDVTMRVSYENPPIYLNLTTLVAATHANHASALLLLSRALRFFQAVNVFTHETVAPVSLSQNAPQNPLDKLAAFKLVLDLVSPSLEEVNHLWGTLGGKQYPFALFNLRLLDLKFRAVQAEGGLITEIVRDFAHRNGVS